MRGRVLVVELRLMPAFTWDRRKENTNRLKHKLDFSLIDLLWSDLFLVIVFDRFEGGEHRYHAIGKIGDTCLVAVHTYPNQDPDQGNDEEIRIIGLRKATARERQRYEEGEFDS